MAGLTEQDINLHIGTQLRALRGLRAVSLVALGKELGVSYQQVQKYEKGRTAFSAAKLYRVSALLDTPLSAFFNGLPGSTGADPLILTPDEIAILALLRGQASVLSPSKVRALLTLLARTGH